MGKLQRAQIALQAAIAVGFNPYPGWRADAEAGLAALAEQLYRAPCPPDCPDCAWEADERNLDKPAPGRVHGVQLAATPLLAVIAKKSNDTDGLPLKGSRWRRALNRQARTADSREEYRQVKRG